MMRGRFASAIKLLLSFQLLAGGSAPLFAQQSPVPPTKASPPPPPPLPELQDLAAIAADVQSVMGRALYPGVVGEAGLPSAGELNALETRLLKTEGELKDLFQDRNFRVQLYNTQVDGQAVQRTDEGKWDEQIKFYFTIVESLLVARYYALNELTPQTWSRFDFRLPMKDFSLLILLTGASESFQDDQTKPGWNAVNLKIDSRRNEIVFSLNPERSLLMFSDRLGHVASIENAKRYLEWTAYFGLYQNLAKLNQLELRRAALLPEPPEKIISAFPIAATLKDFAQTDEKRFIWREQNQVLSDTIDEILRQLNSNGIHFMTADLDKHLDPLAADHDASLKASISDEENISTGFVPDFVYIHQLQDTKSVDAWVNMLADAITEEKTMHARYAWVATKGLPLATRVDFLSAIDQRGRAYRTIPALTGIIAGVVKRSFAKLAPESILQTQRQRFNSDLTAKAVSLKTIPQEIDPASWVDSRRGLFASLEPSNNVQNWIKSVAGTKTFAEAETKYDTVFFSYLSGFKSAALDSLIKQRPLPLAQIAAKLGHVQWDLNRIASDSSASSNIKTVMQSQESARMKDLSDLVAIGRALKMDAPEHSRLNDLKLSAAERAAYDEAYRQNAMSLFPILDTKISKNLFVSSPPLWRTIAPNSDNSGIISEHLSMLETNLGADMQSVEASLGAEDQLSHAWNKFSRWAGLKAAPKGLDGLSARMLVLIHRGSLLSANINQTQHALAASYNELSAGLDRASSFGRAMAFLNEQSNYYMYATIAVSILEWAAMATKVGLLQKISLGVYDWLEPVFGSQLIYLQAAIFGALGISMGYQVYDWKDQSDQQTQLDQYFNSIATIPQQPGTSPDQAIAGCALIGRCLVSSDDVANQALRVADARTRLLVTAASIPIVLGVFWAGGKLIGKMRIFRTSYSPAELQRDFSILGMSSENQSFSKISLDNQFSAAVNRLERTPYPYLNTPAGQQLAIAVTEQSHLNLERAVLEQAKRLDEILTYLEPSFRALGVPSRAAFFSDPQGVEDLLARVNNENLSVSERLALRRHLRTVQNMLGPLERRAQSDPMYKKLLNAAFDRLGMQSSEQIDKSLALIAEQQDQMVHISNFLGPGRGDANIVKGLPSEIRRLMDLMVKNRFGESNLSRAEREVRDVRLYTAWVRALTRGAPR